MKAKALILTLVLLMAMLVSSIPFSPPGKAATAVSVPPAGYGSVDNQAYECLPVTVNVSPAVVQPGQMITINALFEAIPEGKMWNARWRFEVYGVNNNYYKLIANFASTLRDAGHPVSWSVPSDAPEGYYYVKVSTFQECASNYCGEGRAYFAIGDGLDISASYNRSYGNEPPWLYPTGTGRSLHIQWDTFCGSAQGQVNFSVGVFGLGGPHLPIAGYYTEWSVDCQIPFPTQYWTFLATEDFAAGSYEVVVRGDGPNGLFGYDRLFFEVGIKGAVYVTIDGPSYLEVGEFEVGQDYSIPITYTQEVWYSTESQKLRMKVELFDQRPGVPSGNPSDDSTGSHFIDAWEMELIPSAYSVGHSFTYQWKPDWDHARNSDPYEQHLYAYVYLSTWLKGAADWSGWYSCGGSQRIVSPYPLHPKILSERGNAFLRGIRIDNKFYVEMGEGEEPYDSVKFYTGEVSLGGGTPVQIEGKTYSGSDPKTYFVSDSLDMSQFTGSSLFVEVHRGELMGKARLSLAFLDVPQWLKEFDADGKLLMEDFNSSVDFGKGWSLKLTRVATVAGFGVPNAENDPGNRSDWYWVPDEIPVIGGRYGFKAGINVWPNLFGGPTVLLEYNPNNGSAVNAVSGIDYGAAVDAGVHLYLADHDVLPWTTEKFLGQPFGKRADNDLKLWVKSGRITGGSPVFGPFTVELADYTIPLWESPYYLDVPLIGKIGFDMGVRLALGVDVTGMGIYEDDMAKAGQQPLILYDGLTWSPGDTVIAPSIDLEAYGGISCALFGLEIIAYGGGTVYIHLPPPLFPEGGEWFTLEAGLKGKAWMAWVGSVTFNIFSFSTTLPSTTVTEESHSETWQWMERYWATPNYSRFDRTSGSVKGNYLTDPFPYSQPTIATSGTTSVKVWLEDDLSKTYPRSTEIYSSILDPNTMQWSTPERLTDDDLHQWGSPAVEFDANGNAIAVWNVLNQKDVTTHTEISNALCNKTELQYAIWNHDTGTWSQPHLLTHDAVGDTRPVMTRTASGELYCMWLSSSEPVSSMLADMRFSVWNGSSWTEPSVMAEHVPLRSPPTISSQGEQAIVVWDQDMDGNFTTQDDTELYSSSLNRSVYQLPSGEWGVQYKWNAPVRLTNNSVEDRSPSLEPSPNDGPLSLVWIQSQTPEGAHDRHSTLLFADDFADTDNHTVVARDRAMTSPRLLAASESQRIVAWNDGLYQTPVYSVLMAGAESTAANVAWTDPVSLISSSAVAATPFHSFTSYSMTEDGQILVADMAQALEAGGTDKWPWKSGVMYNSVVQSPKAGAEPAVLGTDPASAAQGSVEAVSIIGVNLSEPAEIDFGQGITVHEFVADGSTKVIALVSVDGHAGVGSRDVLVRTPEGVSVLEDGFSVSGGTEFAMPGNLKPKLKDIEYLKPYVDDIEALQKDYDWVVSTPTLIVEDGKMPPTKTVQIPIDIVNASLVGNMDIKVSYDPTVLQAMDVTKGSLSAGSLFDSNIVDGEIRIAFVDAAGINGDGSVAVMQFKVVGKSGDSSELIATVSANKVQAGEAVTIKVKNGIFTVEDAEKMKNDCDGDGDIDSLDALMALQMSVGKIEVNLVADMNDDGQVTSLDAAEIMKLAVSETVVGTSDMQDLLDQLNPSP